MLTKITGLCLKGKTFAYKLDPITIFVGDDQNFNHKSAQGIDAPLLALLGYQPSQGKTNADTWRLYGADGKTRNTLGVSAVVRCGELAGEIRREWVSAGKSVSIATQELPSFLPALNKQGSVVPAMLLDFREYLAMTGQQRRDAIVKNMDVKKAGYKDAALTAAIKNIQLEEHDARAEEVIKELVDDIMQSATERDDAGTSVTEWLAGQVVYMKAKASEAKTEADSYRGHQNAQAVMSAEDAPAIDRTEDVAAMDNRLAELRVKVETLNAQIQQAEKPGKELKALQEKLAKLPDQTETIVTLEAKLKTIDADAPLENHSEDIQRHAKEIAEAETKAKAYVSDSPKLKAALEAAQRAKTNTETAVKNLETQIKECTERWDKKLSAKCCPTCGADGKTWKKKIEKEKASDLAIYAAQIEKHTKALAEQVKGIPKLEKELAASEKKDTENSELWEEVETLRAGKEKLEEEETNARLHRSETESAINSQLATARETQGKRNTLTAQISGLNGSPDTTELVRERTDLETQVSELQEERDAAFEQTKRAIGAKQDSMRSEQSKQKAERADIRQKVYAAAEKVIVAEQEKLVAKAFTTFCEKASTLGEGILPHRLEFRDGDVGWFKGENWVSHWTFSETERLLMYAGLSVALAAEAPLKIVIMDELGRLSKTNKRRLVDRMEKLIGAGVIHQFIGVDVSGDDYKNTVATIINVDSAAVEK